MKTKNKVILSLISFLLVVASVFIALPQGVEAAANDVINGGTNTKQELKNKFDRAHFVFKHYNIKKADIDSLKDGVVHKNGDIYVGNQKVATSARSTGRQALGCNNKVIKIEKDTIYEGSTNCRFASNKLAAFVKFDKDGRFQYAIIKECGNPTTGRPTKPKPKSPVPSIKINKSVNKGNPLLGEQFTYTFTVKNTGETALKNVTITDPAPKGGNGVQLIEFLPDQTLKNQKGLTVTKNKVTVNVGNLAKDASTQTYSIKAKFIKKSNNNFIKNKVCVTGQSTNTNAKPQQVKDCATAQNKTTDLSLGIKKTVSKRIVKVGEEFTYTIAVTNKSQKDLTNLTIYDPATPPIEFIPNSGGGVGANITSTMYAKTGVSLKKGETKTFSFKAKFTKAVSTDVINRACIRTTQKEEFCDTDQNRTELPVEVAKSVDKPEVKIGEEFMYTITLTNTTTADIPAVSLLDAVKTPEYIQLIPGSGTNGLDVKNDVWALKPAAVLKAGETQTFTMKAKYKEGTPAGAIGINEVCTTGATPNSCATAFNKPITPTPPAITITKDVSKEAVHIGEIFTYTVKVTNTGETDIPALNMLDAQPKGIEFIPGTATNGASINSGDPFNTGQQSVWFGKANFSLKAGETQEFSFQAKLVEEVAGDIVNTVCASDGAQIAACDDAKNIMAPIEPPVISECAEGIPVGDERCIPTPEPAAPAVIASTGPGAVVMSVVGISAIGYGARQWVASRRAIQEATEELYK